MKNTIWYFRVYSLQGKRNLYFIIFHFSFFIYFIFLSTPQLRFFSSLK